MSLDTADTLTAYATELETFRRFLVDDGMLAPSLAIAVVVSNLRKMAAAQTPCVCEAERIKMAAWLAAAKASTAYAEVEP